MAGIIDNLKGIISIVRDGMITLVLFLLLLVPACVNQRLIDAGFKKGNIAGFEWEAAVKENNEKLFTAAATINSLQGQLSKTAVALKESDAARETLADQVKKTIPNSPVAQTAAAPPPVPTNQILQQSQQIVGLSEIHENNLRRQIRVNDSLLARIARPGDK